jgi:hypothetical protein
VAGISIACGGSPAPPAAAPAPAESSSAASGSPGAAASAGPTSSSSEPSSSAPSSSSSASSAALPAGGSVLVGEIAGTPKFDPKPAVEDMKSDLLTCFAKARAANPSLHGKVTLKIVVNAAGRVNRVEANPGGTANDATLVACIEDAMKDHAQFPKPPGTATVTAPLVFRR